MLKYFFDWLDSDSPAAIITSALIAFALLWLIIGLLFSLC